MATDPDRTTLYQVDIDATSALKAWDDLIARTQAFEQAGKTAVTQIQAQMNRLGGVVAKGAQSVEKVVAAQAKTEQATRKSADATKKAEEATNRYRDAALRLAEGARLIVDGLREQGRASQEVIDGLTKTIEASARTETAYRATGEAGRAAQTQIREEIKNTLGQQKLQADQEQRLRDLASSSLQEAAQPYQQRGDALDRQTQSLVGATTAEQQFLATAQQSAQAVAGQSGAFDTAEAAAAEYEQKLREQIEAQLQVARSGEESLSGLTAGHRRVVEAVNQEAQARAALNAAARQAKEAETALSAAKKEQQVISTDINAKTRERAEAERNVANAMSNHISAQANLRSATGQYRASLDETKKAQKLYATEIRLQSQAASEGVKTQRQVEAEFRRQLKTYPELVKSLRALVDANGTFRVSLGQNAEAMSDADKAARDLILSNKDLAKEQQRLGELTRGGVFSLQLDRPTTELNTFNKLLGLTPFQLREITRAFDQMGVRGLGTIGSLISVVGPLGLGIAGVGFAIKGVIDLMIKLGEVGIKVFLKMVDLSTQLVESSVEVAAGFDSVEKSLVAMLGSAEAAAGVMGLIRRESEAAGVDFEEIVRKLGPVVGGVEEAITLGKFSLGLAQLDPKQGVKGGLRVLQDALQGNLQPLRKTFAINVEPIRRAQEELGLVNGLLVGLEEVLGQRGLDFKTMSDTWTFAVGRMQEIWRSLQATLGEPVVETLIDQFNDLADFFAENRDLFLTIFNAIGVALTDVLGGSSGLVKDFFQAFDEGDAQAIADSLIVLIESLRSIVVVLLDLNNVNVSLDNLDDVRDQIQATAEAMIGQAAGMRAGVLNFIESLRLLESVRNPARFAQAIATGELQAEIDRFVGNIKDAASIAEEEIENYRQRVNAAQEANRAFAQSLKEPTDAALGFAEAVLAIGRAEGDIAALNEELEPIYKERTELYEDHVAAMEKATRDRIDNELDAELKRTRALLDLDLDTAQKRQDAWIKHYDRLEDARIKNEQSIVDASTDLSDKEQNILRKHNRDLEDLEKENNKRRLKIEEEFIDKLSGLQRKFLFDAEEAVRENDAVRFLELKRRYEFERNELAIDRDKKVEEEEDSAEERRKKLQDALDREIEDAKIANDRKLRDLETALQREFEAQGRALEREFEAIAINEERKRAEIQQAYDRQIEDIATAFDRKIREMEIAYNREIALIANKEAQILAKVEEATARLVAAMAKRRQALVSSMAALGAPGSTAGIPIGTTLPAGAAPIGGFNSPGFTSSGSIGGPVTSPLSPELAPRYIPVPRHEHGGTFAANKPIVVGEGGIEMLIPEFAGRIVPNHNLRNMMFSPPAHLNRAMNFDNRRSVEASIQMVNPNELSPAQLAEVINVVSKMLTRPLR